MEEKRAELYCEVKWICENCGEENEVSPTGRWHKGDVILCDACEVASVVAYDYDHNL